LNFANEFDLVTRSTRKYVRDLVDLFRSIHALPPIEGCGVLKDNLEDPDALDQQFSRDSALAPRQMTKIPHRIMSQPELSHIGQIIVLKADYSSASVAEEATHKWYLRAYVVSPEEFADLLFCRVSVHSKAIYAENVGEISKGRVNDRVGW
jgi:hypothetical protein